MNVFTFINELMLLEFENIRSEQIQIVDHVKRKFGDKIVLTFMLRKN